MNETTIGLRIKTLRKRNGLTQDQLAELLGVTAQAVSKWENDISCPDIAMLPQLAAILGVTTDILLGVAPMPEASQAAPTHEAPAKPQKTAYISLNTSGITLALFVILLGVSLILRSVLHLSVGFWQIVLADGLLCLGLSGLRRWSSLVLSVGVVLFGLYLWLYYFGVLHFSLSGLWLPILLVVWGVSMLLDHLFVSRRTRRRKMHTDDWDASSRRQQSYACENGEFRYSASFCEDSVAVAEPLLRGGKASVSFGEAVIDLSRCEQLAPDAMVKIAVSFGEVRLLVPSHFRVQRDGKAFFGSSGVHGAGALSEDAPTLYVKTSVSFGEVDIRYI